MRTRRLKSHRYRSGSRARISRRALFGSAVAGTAALLATPLLVRSVTKEEIVRTEEDRVRVEEEQRAAEALVAAAGARAGALQQQLAAIDADRYVAVERLRQVRRELETLELEVFDIRRSISQLNVSLADETEIIERKARSLYKAGRTSILETVLAAESFADALDRAASLERLLARDIADIDRLRASRREIELHTADLTARIDRQQQLRTEAESIETELARRSEEQKDLIFNVQQEQAGLVADVEAFEAESAAISYRIALLRDIHQRELDELEHRRIQQELIAKALAEAEAREEAAAEQGADVVGPYIWPLLGLTTTEYGGCTFGQCPHWGMDIAASQGTPIVAANDGVVLAVGLVVPGDRRASYGMIVVIAHSASEETLYAHLDDLTWPPTVAPGQFVSRGQTIGFVGLTGWTTGPHLHLEYRVDGFAQNPRNVFV